MKYLSAAILFFGFMQYLYAQDTVHDAKPVFISRGINRVRVNNIYSYHFQAMASAGASLNYSVKKTPVWLKYDENTNTISGRALKPGQYPIQIEATNQQAVSRQDFMLTVYDNKTTNILCLGNSITNGTSKYNSYRRSLWQMLHAGNYNFNFIGSWDKHHAGGEVPDPDFDMDHEGHSGWNFGDVFHPPEWDSARGNIHDWLKFYKPDIVLVELGTNDVFQCRTVDDVIKDLQVLIQVLRKKNNLVKIFIGQIPPLGKQWATQKLCGNDIEYNEAIQNLNKAFVQFAATYTEKKSPVITVNQYSGVNTGTDMYDDIHPNEKGEKDMAERWFLTIKKYLQKLE